MGYILRLSYWVPDLFHMHDLTSFFFFFFFNKLTSFYNFYKNYSN